MDYSIPEVKPMNLGNVLGTVAQFRSANALQEKNARDEQREQIKMSAEAMSKALSQKDPQSALAVYKAYFPDSTETPDFSFLGDEVTIDSPMGKIVGKKAAVQELYEGMQENPEYFADPKNIQAAVPYLVENGVKELIIKDRKTARAYDLVSGKVVEDTPEEIERKRLESPERFRTVEDLKPSWGASKEGMDDNGKPVIYQVNNEGKVRIVKGVKPEPKKTGGMKVYDKDGNLIVDTGDGPPMTKKTEGEIEGQIIAGTEQVARMESIIKDFKPEYQQVGTRLSASWTALKSKMGRGIADEDASKLAGFKTYQRKSIENINRYIKDFTGAAMSEKEADRLRLAQPDPGEKWYQGDDPITFKAKMGDVLKMSKAAVARFQYYRAKGLSDSEIRGMINNGTAKSLDEIAARMK